MFSCFKTKAYAEYLEVVKVWDLKEGTIYYVKHGQSELKLMSGCGIYRKSFAVAKCLNRQFYLNNIKVMLNADIHVHILYIFSLMYYFSTT